MKIDTKLIRIARSLLIAVILLVLVAVLYDYVQNRRSRNGFAKQAPKILSSNMVRSMEDFDYLITEARKQASKAGLRRKDIATAIAKVRSSG